MSPIFRSNSDNFSLFEILHLGHMNSLVFWVTFRSKFLSKLKIFSYLFIFVDLARNRYSSDVLCKCLSAGTHFCFIVKSRIFASINFRENKDISVISRLKILSILYEENRKYLNIETILHKSFSFCPKSSPLIKFVKIQHKAA